MIRKHRPQIVLAPYYDLPIGRGLGHNDHYKTGQIVGERVQPRPPAPRRRCEGEPHQAKAIYFYFVPPGTLPTFVVDISSYVRGLARGDRLPQEPVLRTPTGRAPNHLPHRCVRCSRRTRATGSWQIGARYAQAYLSAHAAQGRGPAFARAGRHPAAVNFPRVRRLAAALAVLLSALPGDGARAHHDLAAQVDEFHRLRVWSVPPAPHGDRKPTPEAPLAGTVSPATLDQERAWLRAFRARLDAQGPPPASALDAAGPSARC